MSHPSIAVLGMGIVGASIGYHLARRGAEVTMLDRGAPGSGATAWSFGWASDAGGDWPGGAADLRPSSLDDWRRLERELPGLPLRWCGAIAWGPEVDARELRSGAGRVPRADIRTIEPALVDPPDSAVHTPGDLGIDAPAATTALVGGAAAAGARVMADAGEVRLDRTDGRIMLRSARGDVAADVVVLANGAGVAPSARQLGLDLPVDASPARLVSLSAPVGIVRGIVNATDVEVREVHDGELIVARSVDDDPEEVAAILRARLGTDDIAVLRTGVGDRPMPRDRAPIVGRLDPTGSVYAAVMHSGVTLAATVGRLVAQELHDVEPAAALRRCRPERFG